MLQNNIKAPYTHNLILFYISTLLIMGGFFWLALMQGNLLQGDKLSAPLTQVNAQATTLFSNLAANFHHPIALFLLQLIVIILACRLMGALVARIGQPLVIGEVIAGILLGPSFLGLFFPAVQEFLFPKTSLGVVQILSQVGLIFFMFIVGMELDLQGIKKKTGPAFIISHVSIFFPFLLGVVLALYLYLPFAPQQIPFLAFALFMGIAMSITAFPVLARILQERNLTHTPLGSMALTCAAVDDVTAWCLLSLVITIVKAQSLQSALVTIFLSVIYIGLMFGMIRPLLARLFKNVENSQLSQSQTATALLVVLMSSLATELIGIHALFGAFLAGVIMPVSSIFRQTLSHKIEDVSLLILLPLFFAFTGLRTQIGLLNEISLWGVGLLIIAVAILGKFGGTLVAARYTGHSWEESFHLGALMNTRGLVELIILNIGFDLGILTSEVFTMMVLMALVTTFMTGPALNLIAKVFSKQAKTLKS